MKKIFRFAGVCALVVGLFSGASAITWFPEEFTCPVDNEKNIFMVIGSYGSYIYGDRSKYQWVFFPRTSQQTYYMCKKCHLTTFMWDFDKLPKEKLAELRKALDGVKVSKTFKDYQDVPVVERLEAMEKVYTVLAKDEVWWEDFYRIKGFHYAKAGLADKALDARKKSLELLAKFIKDGKSEIPLKLLLYTSASMKHFTNDDKGALEDLQKALETKFQDKDAKPEDVKKSDDGMNERIKDYIEQIKSDKKPRMFDKEPNIHDHDR
jgi:hypothetical protein